MILKLGVILHETKLITELNSEYGGKITSLTSSIRPKQSVTPAPGNVPFQSTGNNFLELLGLLILLVIILVATYYTTRFIGGIKMGQIKNSNFKVIDTYKISQTKYLQIIQVGNKLILIAINKDNISFLTELEENDIKLNSNSNENINFKQILDKLRINNK